MPNFDQKLWRQLYAAADRIKEIAPWEWMFEEEMFGVQDPTSGQFNYVSVMGHLGEHYSIAVYLGDDATNDILNMMENPETSEPTQVLEIRQLQISFEDRNYLEKADRDLLKSLGLKYRGENAWPMFRSYQAGYIPWYLEENEAELLATVLEQAILVFERYADDEDLLIPDENQPLLSNGQETQESDGEPFFVRVPDTTDAGLTWRDAFRVLPPKQEYLLDITMPQASFDRAAKLPRKKGAWEVDFFMIPAPVGQRGQRAQFPYMLLVVDAKSGMILTPEMIEVTDTIIAAMAQIPALLTNLFLSAGYLPTEIHTQSERLTWVLDGWTKELKIRGRNKPFLPALESAKTEMLAFLDQ